MRIHFLSVLRFCDSIWVDNRERKGYIFRSRFYGAHSTSLSVLLGSALLLIGPALLAIALPARRAAFQDPAETLRRE